MKFILDQKVRDLGINFVGVVIEGVHNKVSDVEFDDIQKRRTAAVIEKYQENPEEMDKILKGYRDVHAAIGVPRRKNIPASENLLKLVLKHGHLPSVNVLVDIYNLISIERGVCLGSHDLNYVEGDITLKIVDGSERFIPLGQQEPVLIKQGEYAYVDGANDVICRMEIRQVEKTKTTLATERVFYIVQGNPNVPHQYLRDTAQAIIDETTYYLDGRGSIIFDSEYD